MGRTPPAMLALKRGEGPRVENTVNDLRMTLG